ncbi:ester cyclase [Antarcticibacterium sp. 1MA-6-2]|nr:ester cyclase [Antarcticibacterium sp. 1MA-6-2]UJH92988.1 ester cyclase [Antarcticibacterium sp. 1MA-6-2]
MKEILWEYQPPGKVLKQEECKLAQFENGKLVERWGSSDELGILKQLGVNPVQQ